MSLLEALLAWVGSVLVAAAVPLSTPAVVGLAEALVAVPSVAIAGTAVRPTEAVAAVAVWRLASRLYRLNAVEGGSDG